MKVTYAVDDANHNDTKDYENIHSDHDLVVVLKHAIIRIALSKC